MGAEQLNGAAAWLASFGTLRSAAGSDERPGMARPSPRDATDSGRRALSVLVAPESWSPEVADIPGYRVVLDGVVYNGAELQAELEPDRAAAASGAEIAARAYRAWGEGALQRIKGVFALLVWDRGHDRVLCVRDPLGMHPLFYAKTADALLIAPSIDTLLGHPAVSTGINRALLVEYLTRHWTGSEETCFTGIQRVPPGHVLRVEAEGYSVYRYWNPLPEDLPIAWIPDDEAEERFGTLLRQAVARSLAPGPAGILLSGGLDSSTVAMVAADLCRQAESDPPWALSLTVPEPYDEEGVGRELADDLGMQRHLMSHAEAFGANGPLAAALSLTRVLPAPLFNVGQPAYVRLSSAAGQRGCRSILTGEGSDEWLGTSPWLAENMLRATDILGIYRLQRALARYYSGVRWAGLRGIIWQFGMRPALRSAWNSAAAAGRGLRGFGPRRAAEEMTGALSRLVPEPWIAPDRGLRLQIAERLAANRAADRPSHGIEHAYRRAIHSRFDFPQFGLRAEESFLLGRHSGVPQRDPFWDADLVDLIVRIRPGVRIRGGVSKALLRNKLATRFPARGFANQRKSPSRLMFIRTAMLAEASTAVRALDQHWALGELGVVDPKQAIEFVNHCPEDKGWRAWYLINLETWARAHMHSGHGK